MGVEETRGPHVTVVMIVTVGTPHLRVEAVAIPLQKIQLRVAVAANPHLRNHPKTFAVEIHLQKSRLKVAMKAHLNAAVKDTKGLVATVVTTVIAVIHF